MALIGGIVQLFYARCLHVLGQIHYPESSPCPWRDYIIKKQRCVTAFIAIFSIAGTMILGVIFGAAIGYEKELSRMQKLRPMVTVWSITIMVPDMVITVAMIYHLRRAKGSFRRTDRLLDRVIRSESRYVVELCSPLITTLSRYIAEWFFDIYHNLNRRLSLLGFCA